MSDLKEVYTHKLTFEYNEVAQDWECDLNGTIYAEATFIDLATTINRKLWEEV